MCIFVQYDSSSFWADVDLEAGASEFAFGDKNGSEEIGNLFRRIGRKVEAKGFVGVLGHSASLLGEI